MNCEKGLTSETAERRACGLPSLTPYSFECVIISFSANFPSRVGRRRERKEDVVGGVHSMKLSFITELNKYRNKEIFYISYPELAGSSFTGEI